MGCMLYCSDLRPAREMETGWMKVNLFLLLRAHTFPRRKRETFNVGRLPIISLSTCESWAPPPLNHLKIFQVHVPLLFVLIEYALIVEEVVNQLALV
jgi:hypothetical protein